MNLGIVIAVSDYTGDAKNLPACKEDGTAVAQVLRMSGRFDDVLHVDGDTTGSAVKQKLAEFAKIHKEKEIEEVFFYFTGHGEFVGEEFYYLLTDYQAKKRNQTSLDNSELDGIIRGLSPKLFVKIVDACHSGVSYIKTPEDFREYLKSADKKFEKLYFMYSSQSEQFSYQNDRISYFTESILKSIFNHSSETIRYKDVMSYVSDEFKEHDFQTPLFVTQADYTETFCEITPALKEKIRQYIQEVRDPAVALAQGANGDRTLLALLRADAEGYCSKQEASKVVSDFLNEVEQQRLVGELSELYIRDVHAEQVEPPGAVSIGRWLEQGKDEKKYFARVSKKTETFQQKVPKDPFTIRTVGVLRRDSAADFTYETAAREVVAGFTFTTEMPFQYIKVRLEPKLPNIAPEECYIVPLISRTHLRVFWAFSHLEYVDWDKSSSVGKLEWTTSEVPLKDRSAVQGIAKRIEQRFATFVEKPLRTRLGLDDAQSSGAENDGKPEQPE